MLFHHAGGKVFHHDICPRDQFSRDVARLRLGKIKRNAVLVAIQTDKGRTFAGEIGMLIAARIVAAIRILDLDDFGAKVGERLRAGGSGYDPREIHDQQTVEGCRHTFRPRRTVR
jgi:hypothetical protein